jgi:hypothetical protein
VRLFYFGKDGGQESTVWGFWLCEFKKLFSIVLLRFENGTRDAYHSHAFDAVSWVLRGKLREEILAGKTTIYRPSWLPIVTRRHCFHRVESIGRSWVLSFRGPWLDRWLEYLPKEGRVVELTHGRKEIA